MGLLGSLFGGGTKLEVKLDSSQIPEGGLLSGTLFLTGGKKPLTLTSLKVRLVYVQVTPVEGQALPKIDLRVLLDNTVASNQALEPGGLTKYPFTLTVPKGTDPKGTYKVQAVADIPGVMDPKAEADLKVTASVERGFLGLQKGAAASDADTLFARFPGLRSTSERELEDALFDLQNAAYSPEENLVVAEPLLARLMREGAPKLRHVALRCWGTVLNNRARPEHIRTLEAIAADPSTDTKLMLDVCEVAAKFAEEGALPLVRGLMKHPSIQVRSQLATALYLYADKKLKERKGLLIELASDPDGDVRAAAVGAFGDFFRADPEMVGRCTQVLGSDPSPQVKAAALRCLSYSAHYSSVDAVYAIFTEHAHSPMPEVRREVADLLASLPEDPRLAGLVEGLLADADAQVRRRMAAQSGNLAENAHLAPLFVRAATSDPVLEVRADALEGLARMMPLGEAVALYRQRMATDMAEAVLWNVINGLRTLKAEPPARQLLEEIAASKTYAEPARYAREVLAGD